MCRGCNLLLPLAFPLTRYFPRNNIQNTSKMIDCINNDNCNEETNENIDKKAFRHYIDHSYHLPAPPILESIEALNSENNYSFGPTHSANNEAFSQSLDFAHIASPPRVDKMMADEDENVENDCGRSRTTFAPDFTLPPVITMEGDATEEPDSATDGVMMNTTTDNFDDYDNDSMCFADDVGAEDSQVSGSDGSATTTTMDGSGSTIVRLTRQLVALLNDSSAGVLDLKEVIEKMESTHKRRILDVVNILEGANLIERGYSKNIIRWVGDNFFENSQNEVHSLEEFRRLNTLRSEVAELEQQETSLDQHINWIKQSYRNVSESVENTSLAYTTQEDLKTIFPDLINIAVQAPPSITIEANTVGRVTHPEKMSYELKLQSKTLLAKVYILSEDDDGGNE